MMFAIRRTTTTNGPLFPSLLTDAFDGPAMTGLVVKRNATRRRRKVDRFYYMCDGPRAWYHRQRWMTTVRLRKLVLARFNRDSPQRALTMAQQDLILVLCYRNGQIKPFRFRKLSTLHSPHQVVRALMRNQSRRESYSNQENWRWGKEKRWFDQVSKLGDTRKNSGPSYFSPYRKLDGG